MLSKLGRTLSHFWYWVRSVSQCDGRGPASDFVEITFAKELIGMVSHVRATWEPSWYPNSHYKKALLSYGLTATLVCTTSYLDKVHRTKPHSIPSQAG